MRKLIVSNVVSLGGQYIEGPDWPLEIMDEAFDSYNAERLRAADTMLLGRTSYEGFRDFWPSVADDPDPGWTPTHREISQLMSAIDKVVVSDTITSGETATWRNNTRIVRRADAHAEIAELKHDAGNDILVFGSHTLWNDLLAGNLVDELHLMIGAALVAPGRMLFEGTATVPLRLVDEPRTWSGSSNVLVRYEVSRT